MPRTSAPALGLVDLIYATPWVIGAFLLHDIPETATVILVPLFAASWWQDWRSARAASTYFAGELVGFDALTAANYIGLVESWRRSADDGHLLHTVTVIHWTGIFVIYIAWNLALARSAEPRTRRTFLAFSVAEVPLVLIGTTIVATETLEAPLADPVVTALVVAMAAGHVALLVVWRLMSRRDTA